MASPITTSTGLGSGLDIGSIVSALVGADTAAATSQITTQTASVTSKLSGVGQLKSALAAYQTALTNLGSTTTPAFAGFTASSSNTSTLTTTSDNTAVPGSYTIAVQNLATSSSVASASFSGGATSAIPTGTLTISQNGTAYNVTIPSGSTLQSVRDAINTSQNSNGISANIVTDKNGARLVLSSTTTGAGSDLTVSGIAGLNIDGTQTLSSTDPTSAGNISGLAQDANYTVSGFPITSKSNTVTPIGGITMTLLAGSTNGVPATSTVTVAQNTNGLQTSLQSFVSAYNSLMKTLNSLTAPGTQDPTTGQISGSGAMSGDSLPSNLIAALQTQLVTPGPGSQLSVLSQLGINTNQTDGTLTLDTTKYAAAMTNPTIGAQVQQMFSGTNSTNGLMARMTAALTPYTQTGGVLDMRTTSLNQQQSDLSNQQANLTQHTTDLTAQLTAKYNAMDLIVGQLKATATSLTSFFDSLNASKSG
ncbi:MAG: flagellar filament capping protein FliD [Formivibrio sp.]|nr:flagellar filament capping protein FliD [Formivibrio sp.]